MTTSPKCIHCKTTMAIGFQRDHTHGAIFHTTWVEGTPEDLKMLGLTLGVKPAKGARVLPITLFRCPTCGYLESYALPVEPSKK